MLHTKLCFYQNTAVQHLHRCRCLLGLWSFLPEVMAFLCRWSLLSCCGDELVYYESEAQNFTITVDCPWCNLSKKKKKFLEVLWADETKMSQPANQKCVNAQQIFWCWITIMYSRLSWTIDVKRKLCHICKWASLLNTPECLCMAIGLLFVLFFVCVYFIG